MKRFISLFLLIASTMAITRFSQARDDGDRPRRGREALIDRLLECEDQKRDMEDQIDDLLAEIEDLKKAPVVVKKSWSCTIGCQGLGNTGHGTGSTKAEAEANARANFGFTCSPPPVVNCDYEIIN